MIAHRKWHIKCSSYNIINFTNSLSPKCAIFQIGFASCPTCKGSEGLAAGISSLQTGPQSHVSTSLKSLLSWRNLGKAETTWASLSLMSAHSIFPCSWTGGMPRRQSYVSCRLSCATIERGKSIAYSPSKDHMISGHETPAEVALPCPLPVAYVINSGLTDTPKLDVKQKVSRIFSVQQSKRR